MLKNDLIKGIKKEIKATEKQVKELTIDSTLEKPVKNDVILSLRNMAYNEIVSIVKKYDKERE